ncbi:hypothetical protein CU098_005710, partial [Rhizopus stolonifer]
MSTSVSVKNSQDKGMLRYLNEPKCFSGGNDYEEATTWLDRMARLQVATRMSDDERLFVAGDHLVEKAATWWKVVGKISTTWNSFEEAFKEQYLADREGPKDSIDDVAFRMQELFDLLGNKNDDIQVSMFLDAIDPKIAFEVVKDITPLTLKEARTRAKQVERGIQRYNVRPGSSVAGYQDRGNLSTGSTSGCASGDLSSAVSTMFSLADKLEKLTINLVRAKDVMVPDECATITGFWFQFDSYLGKRVRTSVEEVTGVRKENSNPLNNTSNERNEIKLVDTVREEAFDDTGEVYVKRRADGVPMVESGSTRAAKRVVTGETEARNVVAPLRPSGVYSGAQENFFGDFSNGIPGPSGTLGGTIRPHIPMPSAVSNTHGGVLQGVIAPPGNTGNNGQWGLGNNVLGQQAMRSGVSFDKPVKKRAPRKKARRLPVKLKHGRTIWDILDQCKADISATELIALDAKAQKDMVDGIRFLRESKRKMNKPVESMVMDKDDTNPGINVGSVANPAVVNVVDQDWETEDSQSEDSSVDTSSMYFEGDVVGDDHDSMTTDFDD